MILIKTRFQVWKSWLPSPCLHITWPGRLARHDHSYTLRKFVPCSELSSLIRKQNLRFVYTFFSLPLQHHCCQSVTWSTTVHLRFENPAIECVMFNCFCMSRALYYRFSVSRDFLHSPLCITCSLCVSRNSDAWVWLSTGESVWRITCRPQVWLTEVLPSYRDVYPAVTLPAACNVSAAVAASHAPLFRQHTTHIHPTISTPSHKGRLTVYTAFKIFEAEGKRTQARVCKQGNALLNSLDETFPIIVW